MSLPFLLAPPEAKGRIITMTGTGSLPGEEAESHGLPRRREVPPPMRREALNLSEEENSLSKAP